METWLGAIRNIQGRSQKSVSEQIGITQATYCNIELGKRRPSVETAKKIGAALGFDWTRFYEDEDEKETGKEAG